MLTGKEAELLDAMLSMSLSEFLAAEAVKEFNESAPDIDPGEYARIYLEFQAAIKEIKENGTL